MADARHITPLGVPSVAPENLRTLVEVDRRGGSIGLHVASDPTRSARTSSSLWLVPNRAEALANELLAAVEAWRAHETTVAWTAAQGGRAHG